MSINSPVITDTPSSGPLWPNSITLAGSELVRSWFEAGSKLVRAEIWPAGFWLTGSKLARASRFAAKFHYAIWFEAGSKLVADRFQAGRRPASNLSATSFEPASVMEFDHYGANNYDGWYAGRRLGGFYVWCAEKLRHQCIKCNRPFIQANTPTVAL